MHSRKLYYTARSFIAKQTALMHNKKALMYNKQLYCTVEGFTVESFNAQQATSMHSRKLYCTAGSFIAHGKLYCTAESFAT